MVRLSIIIPAYNEEKRITRTLDNYAKFFLKKIRDFEIIKAGQLLKDLKKPGET